MRGVIAAVRLLRGVVVGCGAGITAHRQECLCHWWECYREIQSFARPIKSALAHDEEYVVAATRRVV